VLTPGPISSWQLKQRFFNVIQISDRVFEPYDGVPTLNFDIGEPYLVQGKEEDHDHEEEGAERGFFDEEEETKKAPTLPGPIVDNKNLHKINDTTAPSKVIIRNGTIGLSSHNCIHGGGGPRKIIVEDIWCRDFEVRHSVDRAEDMDRWDLTVRVVGHAA
jgi:hypothetical protein